MTGPRILITYPFPLGRASGGARMTREIARHLGRAGARVTLLPVSAGLDDSFRRRAVEDEHLGLEYDEDLARDGVTIERVAPHPRHRFLDALQVRRAVERILDRDAADPVDVVLSYFIESAFLPSLLRKRGVHFGFISTWQSYAKALTFTMKGLPKFVSRRVRHRLLNVPHRAGEVLFATSDFTRNELIEELGVEPERIELCHLGVEQHFLEIPRRKPEEITRLLFFGRIIESKGVGDAIEALGRIARNGRSDFVLRLRGQGEHEWALAMAREHGISDRVQVCGPANDAELRDELEQAHLAVMPSHYEAFGLAFAEAQAAGLPVVAYRAGSVPEIVQHGKTGWLAPLGDVERLGAYLRQALDDVETTYAAGIAARERVRELFTWENTAATILDRVRAL